MSQAIGLDNIAKLEAFFTEREKEGDWEYFISDNGFDLNKSRVADDAGLASRKTVTGGKGISKVYDDKISDLIERKILTKDTRTVDDKATSKTLTKIETSELKRAKKIAETNAALEEELFQERKDNEKLKAELKKFEKIQSYMESTGRW